MVGIGVDVQWVVARFSVWVIFSGCDHEVECNSLSETESIRTAQYFQNTSGT